MKPDYLELFRALGRAGVDYIVVGGVAAILEGAPITTLDLDIVCRRDDDNLRRLTELLDDLEARYRDPAGRVIRPTPDRLASNKINLLETSLGPDWDWADLVSRSRLLEVGGLDLRVLKLASVIESKELADREKDRAMLPVLRRTLEEKG